jgi:predicted GTPase
MKTDDITQKLGDTLKEFLGFFKKELHKKVLELGTNIKSKDYFEELTRVSNSLEQYVQKDVSLFYVGFLGSYSSGKSSTINSLLQLWDTDKARIVSNNPTDTSITLITNQNNVNNVFTFAKEGAIPIRTYTNFDSPLLENIVLMDTPGSGDPNIIESIVRDSLPLCDLIIYTLNATAPFTDIDKPFLVAQQSKLKNIPLLFILTRGDEYKIDKSKIISFNNFDNKRCNDDLITIVNRINEAIKISEFKESDFTIVDNRANFNIDELINKISSFTNNSNDNLLILHNHKLTYFRNEIKAIHNYYLKLSIDKIDKCEKFLKKANDNIEYFDQQIELSKMKFRALWNDNNLIFTKIYDGTVKGYISGQVEELEKITKLKESLDFYTFRNDIKSDLEKNAKALSQQIIKTIDEKANKDVTDLKNKVLNLLNEESLIVNDKLIIDEEFKYNLSSPLDKESYIENFIKLSKNKIIDDNKRINDSIKTITKSLQQSKPLDSINEKIINYEKAFEEVLNLYYDAIKMYNVVAFSFEVKSYISELGLAKDFDKLESGEINKAKYNVIAKKELIGNFKEYSDNFEEGLRTNLNKLNQISSVLNYSELEFKDLKEEILKVFINPTEDLYSTSEITTFLTNSYQKLLSNLQDNLFYLKKEVKSLKRKRVTRYFIFLLIPLIGTLFYWFFYKLKGLETPTTLNSTILIGIGCSLVATLLSGIFDKYKIKKIKKISAFKEEIRRKNDLLVEEIIKEYRDTNQQREQNVTTWIFDIWNNEEQLLLSKLLESNIISVHNKNLKIKSDLHSILDSYKSVYDIFNTKILDLFDHQEDSLKRIDSIALLIKEDSIRPSFELLQNTIEEIKLVKTEIEVLDY